MNVLNWIPRPWRGRVTLRRPRRWVNATRGNARHNARLPKDAPVLNFYPMRPQPHAPICEIMRRLGLRIGYTPGAGQATIAWHVGTWLTGRAVERLPPDAINGRCRDISKSRVAEAWELVAGYPLAVDPLTTSGPMVVKPEANARQGGRIIEGPLDQRQSGKVYERLIDARPPGRPDQIRPLRAVVMGPRVVLVYEKWRAFPKWFKGTDLTIARAPADLLSEAEQALLVRFAAEIGMDYGELDVLRDADSDLIYVVDANRTSSAPINLPPEQIEDAYGPMTEAFGALVFG